MTMTKSAMTAVGAVIATLVLVLGAVFLPFTPAGATGGGTNKISFCHATGSDTNPYVHLTTSVAAFYNAGHLDHQNDEDIFPAGSFKDQSWAAQGDQSILANGCVVPGQEEPVVTQEQDEVYSPGDCATLTQVVTTTTYEVIDGVRQEPPISVVTSTVPWIPEGDECEVEETTPPTPTETVTVTPPVPTETVTETPAPETPVAVPSPTVTPEPQNPDKDKDEPVKPPRSTPQPPKDVQVIACVDGVWTTQVNGVTISESGSCEVTAENSEFQTFSETGL